MDSLKSRSETTETKTPKILIKILMGCYVLLWVVHYMLVHASAHPRYRHLSKGKLNQPFVIMMTELSKLLISAGIFLAQKFLEKNETGTNKTDDSIVQTFQFGPVLTLFKQYLPVAFLYSLGNNLMLNNLQHYEPTIYLILASSRLIMTAVLMRIFLEKKISQMQKIAILIITLGLLLQDSSSSEEAGENQGIWASLSHLGLILLQMLCGTLASIYNEKLLKNRNKGGDGNFKPITSVFAANICLYVESILLNGLAFMLMSHESADSARAKMNLFLSDHLQQGIILTLALVGIITSFIICHVDSLSKAVASASTVVFTTTLGYILFDYEISMRIAFSSILVSVGVHSYAFSNTTDENMTLGVVFLSLKDTLVQLWFIPVFFWVFNTIQYSRLVLDAQQNITNYRKG